MQELHLPHDHGAFSEDALSQLQCAEGFAAVAEVFKQLGDESRIRIFWVLCHWETCVSNLSAMVDMSSPAVSHHLRQLKAGELVVSRREGKEVYYRAADTVKTRLLHHMVEEMLEITCPTQEP